MADNKKSFVAYCDWGDIFDELSDEEAGVLVKHLFDYVRDKDPTPKDKLTKLMFIQIQQSLKRDLLKYENYLKKQSDNGKKGGRPKNPPVNQKTQPFNKEPKKADSVNVNVTDNGNVNDNDNDNVIMESSKQAYHKHIYQCYDYLLQYFDEHLHPKTESQKNKWLDTIEKLRRLDKIPYKTIVEIVQKTRADSFWGKHFLSLTKLRKTNKDGVKYVIVFNEQIKSNGKGQQTNGQQYSKEWLDQLAEDLK